MVRVTLYTWPESQECLECKFSEGLGGDARRICHINHDKVKEDKCTLFTLQAKGAFELLLEGVHDGRAKG